jgi:hypothetical protein
VSASLGTNVGRVGDPLTLTARVSGEGNVKLLPPPHLDVPWASAVPSDQRVQVDSTSAHIGGRKEFDWVLTPRIAGELDVPPVRYSYFDPATRRYETARSNPIRVRVLPGALANADTSKGEAPLPVRTIYTGPGHAPLSSHPVFWLVLALAPLPALRARWRSRRPRGRRSKSVHARLGDAARVGFADQDGRSLRREFVRALGERLAVDAEAFSTPGALRTALRRAGVQAPTANAAEALLRQLDAAAFAPDGQLDEGDGPAAVALMAQIDAEALPRRELPFRAGVLIVLMAIGVAGSLRAVQQVQPADLFANGVVAYQEHNYAGARDAFARVTAVAPRSPDAWVNYGTAAWALRDTVDAVVGWRHGLGLQPLAGDARSRLGLVHGVRPLSPGYAPPVPVNALLLLMSLCWLSACAAWHPALRRRARWTGAWPVPLIVAAVAIGLVAVADGDALSGRGAAVVRASTSLHDDPALGADQGPVVVIGEMVRVLSQSGAWDRVELDGGRQGWLPAQGLVPLDAPAPPPLD